MKKAARLLLAILAGVLLTETGLRLYFHESEAMRSYWGRGAFVIDEQLGYRHAPSVTAWTAREGSFGPFPITTNSLGYRDRRELSPADPPVPRLAVGGDSFTFGLGVGEYEKTFAARLEVLLRDDPEFPRNLEVINMSQTGYRVDQVCMLIERDLDIVRPGMVLIAIDLHDRYMTPGPIQSPELLDGHRLSPSRWFAGTFVDKLRVNTFLLPRVSASPLLKPQVYTQDALLTKLIPAGARDGGRSEPGEAAGDDPGSAGDAPIPASLGRLRDVLEERGIPLVCMVIYLPFDRGSATSDALRSAGYAVIDVHCRPGWILGGDSHWNVAGERESAAIVAKGMPPWPRAAEARP